MGVLISTLKIIYDNCLKDQTSYKSGTKKRIDSAISYPSEDVSLGMMTAIAQEIDCEEFHAYWNSLSNRNIEAREQYNRLCYHIALICYRKGRYSDVREWADKLALFGSIPYGFRNLLDSEDFKKIESTMKRAEMEYESDADWWREHINRPTTDF